MAFFWLSRLGVINVRGRTSLIGVNGDTPIAFSRPAILKREKCDKTPKSQYFGKSELQ
jgi:hypothetical protein